MKKRTQHFLNIFFLVQPRKRCGIDACQGGVEPQFQEVGNLMHHQR
jgi:hypothetical protein